MNCGCSSTVALVGSTPTVTFTFVDVDGDPADPSTLSIRVLDPAGNVVAYDHTDLEVANPAVGTWTWRPADGLDLAGEWWVYVAASGGGTDIAAETSFSIADTRVPLGS